MNSRATACRDRREADTARHLLHLCQRASCATAGPRIFYSDKQAGIKPPVNPSVFPPKTREAIVLSLAERLKCDPGNSQEPPPHHAAAVAVLRGRGQGARGGPSAVAALHARPDRDGTCRFQRVRRVLLRRRWVLLLEHLRVGALCSCASCRRTCRRARWPSTAELIQAP